MSTDPSSRTLVRSTVDATTSARPVTSSASCSRLRCTKPAATSTRPPTISQRAGADLVGAAATGRSLSTCDPGDRSARPDGHSNAPSEWRGSNAPVRSWRPLDLHAEGAQPRRPLDQGNGAHRPTRRRGVEWMQVSRQRRCHHRGGDAAASMRYAASPDAMTLLGPRHGPPPHGPDQREHHPRRIAAQVDAAREPISLDDHVCRVGSAAYLEPRQVPRPGR